jgi:hypothetical protein
MDLLWSLAAKQSAAKVSLKNEFPSLEETLDMAALSLLFYRVKKKKKN